MRDRQKWFVVLAGTPGRQNWENWLRRIDGAEVTISRMEGAKVEWWNIAHEIEASEVTRFLVIFQAAGMLEFAQAHGTFSSLRAHFVGRRDVRFLLARTGPEVEVGCETLLAYMSDMGVAIGANNTWLGEGRNAIGSLMGLYDRGAP